MKSFVSMAKIGVPLVSTFWLAGLVTAHPDDQAERVVIVRDQTLEADEPVAPLATVEVTTATESTEDDPAAPVPPDAPTPPTAPLAPEAPGVLPDQNDIVIQTIEPSGKKKPSKPVTWLGLAVEETTEALSSQLGLKPGEGLTVNFLAPESPASKADFHKNDVLVELDGQMLVHPIQLRKLIQMHADGEAVKVTFFRGGKKQTVSVKLGKTTWEEEADTEEKAWPGNLQNLQLHLSGLKNGLRDANRLDRLTGLNDLNGQLAGVNESLARVGLDKAKVNREAKRAMEQACRAIQEAMRHVSTDQKSLAAVDMELQALARGGVDVDKDATVTIRNKRNSTRTMVQTDDDGSYIIEAGAKTHLTARDKDGKLLFEGNIDTPAERAKIPAEVWEKVKPMLDQIVAPPGAKPKTEGKFREKSEYLKQSACSCVIRVCLT